MGLTVKRDEVVLTHRVELARAWAAETAWKTKYFAKRSQVKEEEKT
jgi:hypothetical protein